MNETVITKICQIKIEPPLTKMAIWKFVIQNVILNRENLIFLKIWCRIALPFFNKFLLYFFSLQIDFHKILDQNIIKISQFISE